MENGEKAPRIFSVGIENEPFGLSEQDVVTTISEVRKTLEEWEEALPDADEKLRRIAERAMPAVQEELAALTSMPSAEIFRYVEAVYRTAKALEGRVPEKVAAQKLKEEFPLLIGLYPLLKKQEWGYELGQLLFAGSTRR